MDESRTVSGRKSGGPSGHIGDTICVVGTDHERVAAKFAVETNRSGDADFAMIVTDFGERSRSLLQGDKPR